MHASYCPNNVTNCCVICHVPMSHVMYPCHLLCIYVIFQQSGHFICVMCYVTCHLSCHVSWHKSLNVKYLSTHILLIVLSNYLTILTILSNVLMSHVMYPCHMSCIHVTCNVFMSHSNSQVISFYKSEYWITLDNMRYYKFL